MKRVLIEPGRIRVSKPGYDVTRASVGNLAFDSKYSSIGFAVSGEFKSAYRSPNSLPEAKVINWRTSNRLAREFAGAPILFLMQLRNTQNPFTLKLETAWVPSQTFFVTYNQINNTIAGYYGGNPTIVEMRPNLGIFYPFASRATVRYKALI